RGQARPRPTPTGSQKARLPRLFAFKGKDTGLGQCSEMTPTYKGSGIDPTHVSQRSGHFRFTNSTVAPVATPKAMAAQTTSQFPRITDTRSISAGRPR